MKRKQFEAREEVIAYLDKGGKLTHKLCENFQQDLACITHFYRKGGEIDFPMEILDAPLLIAVLRAGRFIHSDHPRLAELLADRMTSQLILQDSEIQVKLHSEFMLGTINLALSMPAEFLNDPFMASLIRDNYPGWLEWLPFRFRDDETFMSKGEPSLDWANALGETLRNSHEFMLWACKAYPFCAGYAGQKLLTDKEFAKQYYMNAGSQMTDAAAIELRKFDYSIRFDEEVMLAAISADGSNFEYLSEDKRGDIYWLLIALKSASPWAIATNYASWKSHFELPIYQERSDFETYKQEAVELVQNFIFAQSLESSLHEKIEAPIKRIKI